MPKASKKLGLRKNKKSLPTAYPWIIVPRPEGRPLPKKVVEINKMLAEGNITWHDPRFGPNAK